MINDLQSFQGGASTGLRAISNNLGIITSSALGAGTGVGVAVLAVEALSTAAVFLAPQLENLFTSERTREVREYKEQVEGVGEAFRGLLDIKLPDLAPATLEGLRRARDESAGIVASLATQIEGLETRANNLRFRFDIANLSNNKQAITQLREEIN